MKTDSVQAWNSDIVPSEATERVSTVAEPPEVTMLFLLGKEDAPWGAWVAVEGPPQTLG